MFERIVTFSSSDISSQHLPDDCWGDGEGDGCGSGGGVMAADEDVDGRIGSDGSSGVGVGVIADGCGLMIWLRDSHCGMFDIPGVRA